LYKCLGELSCINANNYKLLTENLLISHSYRQQRITSAVLLIHANIHLSSSPKNLVFTLQPRPPGLRNVIYGVYSTPATTEEDARRDHLPHIQPNLMKVWSHNSTPHLELYGLFYGKLNQ